MSFRCSMPSGKSAAKVTSSRPSLGKVPILWDGDIVVWDSLAIIEFLADRYGTQLYWPEDEGARGVARSMAAEMHSGFANLRRELPMNVRKSFPPKTLSEPCAKRSTVSCSYGRRPGPAAAGPATSCSATGAQPT